MITADKEFLKGLDVGTLVFNGGEAHSVKLIPSYIRGRFVCRDDVCFPQRANARISP